MAAGLCLWALGYFFFSFLTAFFPALRASVALTVKAFAPAADVALLDLAADATAVPALPLADGQPQPGQQVTIVGFPLGLDGVLAKAPSPIFRSMRFESDDLKVADQLAALSLIRPTSTAGQIGDVVGTTLVLDAATSHGGSGGPVFNQRGKVVGITAGTLRDFSSGTVAIDTAVLREILP